MQTRHRKLLFGITLLLTQAACQVNPLEQLSATSVPSRKFVTIPSKTVDVVVPKHDSVAKQEPQEIEYSNLWDRIGSGVTFTNRFSHASIDEELQLYINKQYYFDEIASRAEPFLFWIVEEIEQRGLPVELALLPIVESSFDPEAYSPESAAGLWQFMGPTAKSYGLQKDRWYDGRKDPLASTIAALDYLEILHNQFDNDWLLALAAYNAGEGTVQRAIRKNKRSGKPTSFWDLNLPKETTAHVPRLLAIAKLINEAPSYGIELTAIANEPYFEVVELDFQVNLSQAARAASIDPDLMSSLNPGYLQSSTHPESPQFLVVPKPHVDLLMSSITDLPDDPQLGLVQYEIRPGDSLSTIARAFNTTTKILQDFNDLEGSRIIAGRYLMIPGKTIDEKGSNNPPDATVLDITNKPLQFESYQVQSGDSLWSIARKFNLKTSELARINEISINSLLHPNQVLVIPRPIAQAKTGTGRILYQQKVDYQISIGDSLDKIAGEFSITVDDIISWNGLNPSSLIFPGQMLALYIPSTDFD